jgi:hypothetical protein
MMVLILLFLMEIKVKEYIYLIMKGENILNSMNF